MTRMMLGVGRHGPETLLDPPGLVVRGYHDAQGRPGAAHSDFIGRRDGHVHLPGRQQSGVGRGRDGSCEPSCRPEATDPTANATRWPCRCLFADGPGPAAFLSTPRAWSSASRSNRRHRGATAVHPGVRTLRYATRVCRFAAIRGGPDDLDLRPSHLYVLPQGGHAARRVWCRGRTARLLSRPLHRR